MNVFAFIFSSIELTQSNFKIFVLLRKVTLVMVGLDNAGKTATAKGIQGGKQKIFITKLFRFIYLFTFSITYSLSTGSMHSVILYSHCTVANMVNRLRLHNTSLFSCFIFE